MLREPDAEAGTAVAVMARTVPLMIVVAISTAVSRGRSRRQVLGGPPPATVTPRDVRVRLPRIQQIGPRGTEIPRGGELAKRAAAGPATRWQRRRRSTAAGRAPGPAGAGWPAALGWPGFGLGPEPRSDPSAWRPGACGGALPCGDRGEPRLPEPVPRR